MVGMKVKSGWSLIDGKLGDLRGEQASGEYPKFRLIYAGTDPLDSTASTTTGQAVQTTQPLGPAIIPISPTTTPVPASGPINNGTSPPPEGAAVDNSGPNTGAIVGGIIGGLAALVCRSTPFLSRYRSRADWTGAPLLYVP